MGDKLTGATQDNFGNDETVLVHNFVDRYTTQSTCQNPQNHKGYVLLYVSKNKMWRY